VNTDRPMAAHATLGLLLVLAWPCPVQAGYLTESLQELKETLNNREQFNRCYEREKEAGTFNYSQCAENSGRRRQDFEAEQDRSRSDLRRKQESEQQELDELLKMPNVSDEIHARFGQVITFEECMSVYDERDMYKRGFTRSDARSSCTTFVNNIRAYCLKSRDEQCAEKGFLRPDQTAGALQQQQFEAQQKQQEAMERRQEQEQQRRKALRDQWIRQGGTPGVCPGPQALLNKNHPCHY